MAASHSSSDAPSRLPVGAVVAAVVLTGAVLTLVAWSLRRPEVPVFVPTAGAALPDPAGGPVVFTLDASDPERWRYFSFARGSLLERPGPGDWDLAFRRFDMRVNGGDGFPGSAGVLELGPVSLDSVGPLPAGGYVGMTVTGRDTSHVMLDDWYRYSFTSHVLRPRDTTFGVRTADGGTAAFRVLSYYCPGARPGCMTIRYLYRPPAAATGGPPGSAARP